VVLWVLGYNWLAWRSATTGAGASDAAVGTRSPIFIIAPLFSLMAVGLINGQYLAEPDHRLWFLALLAFLLDPSSYLLLRAMRRRD